MRVYEGSSEVGGVAQGQSPLKSDQHYISKDSPLLHSHGVVASLSLDKSIGGQLQAAMDGEDQGVAVDIGPVAGDVVGQHLNFRAVGIGCCMARRLLNLEWQRVLQLHDNLVAPRFTKKVFWDEFKLLHFDCQLIFLPLYAHHFILIVFHQCRLISSSSSLCEPMAQPAAVMT